VSLGASGRVLKRPSVNVWRWLGVVAYVALAALEVLNAVRGGINGGSLIGVVLGIATVVLFFFLIDMRIVSHRKTVERAHPGAYVSSIVAYPELIAQLRKLRDVLGTANVPLRANRYYTIGVTESDLIFFGGFWANREFLTIPMSFVADVCTVQAPQGKWQLYCIELRFKAPQTSLPLDLCLLRIRYGLPRVVPKGVLETQRDVLIRTTGLEVHK
jgi:hypothetical protein